MPVDWIPAFRFEAVSGHLTCGVLAEHAFLLTLSRFKLRGLRSYSDKGGRFTAL